MVGVGGGATHRSKQRPLTNRAGGETPSTGKQAETNTGPGTPPRKREGRGRRRTPEHKNGQTPPGSKSERRPRTRDRTAGPPGGAGGHAERTGDRDEASEGRARREGAHQGGRTPSESRTARTPPPRGHGEHRSTRDARPDSSIGAPGTTDRNRHTRSSNRSSKAPGRTPGGPRQTAGTAETDGRPSH